MLKINEYYNTASEDVLLFLEDLETQMDNNEFLQNNLSQRMLYFTQYVNKLHDGGYTYLEAMAEFCQTHDISHEDSLKLITHDMKAKLYLECVANNMIKTDDELGQTLAL